MFSSASDRSRSPQRDDERGLSMVESPSDGDEDDAVRSSLSPMRREHASSAISKGSATNSGIVSEVVTPPGSPPYVGALATPSSPATQNEHDGFDKLDPSISTPSTQVRRNKVRSDSRGWPEEVAGHGGIGEGPPQERADVDMEGDRAGHVGGLGDRQRFPRRSSSGEYYDSGDDWRKRFIHTPRFLPRSEDIDLDAEDYFDFEQPNVRGRRHLRSRSEGSSSYASGSYLTSDYDSSRVPSDYSSVMTSHFDSSTTFAGGSEFTSVSTSMSQRNTGPILDAESPWWASSELQRRPQQRQHRLTPGFVTRDERANTGEFVTSSEESWSRSGAGWTKAPLSEARAVSNHDEDNVTPPRSRSGSIDQPQRNHQHRNGVVLGGGSAPRRSSRSRRTLEKQMSSQSSVSGTSSMYSGSKPKHLPRALLTPKRAVMSPHGVAMDAALKMVEERGARLGIVREEAVSSADKGGERDLTYDNQIAAPAMTSLEQRRQRAKAWARSRAGGDSHRLRTGAMPTLDKDGNVVRLEVMSRDFSSSGSESELASCASSMGIGSVGHTPVRSRSTARSSVGTTPARSRSSRSSAAGRAAPLPRGTARVRGGGGGGSDVSSTRGGAPRGSPSWENGSVGSRVRGEISAGSGHVGRSRAHDEGGHITVNSGRQSSLGEVKPPKTRSNGVGVGWEREQPQVPTGHIPGSKKGMIIKGKPGTRSMPNMLLVAPLSRPIPTDSVGYLYGDLHEPPPRSPKTDTPSRVHPPHPQPSKFHKKSREEKSSRRSVLLAPLHATYASKSMRMYTHSQSPRRKLGPDLESRDHMPAPQEAAETARARSGSVRDRERGRNEDNVGRYRRVPSVPSGDSDDISTSRQSQQAIVRDRSDSSRGGSSGSGRRTHERSGTDSSARNKPDREGCRSPPGRDDSGELERLPKRDSSGEIGSATRRARDENGRLGGSSGEVTAAKTVAKRATPEWRKARSRSGDTGTNGGQRPSQIGAVEKSRTLKDVEVAAANRERVAAAEATEAVKAAEVIRAKRAAEVRALEAARAFKAREEAEIEEAKAAKALEAAKAAAAAVVRKVSQADISTGSPSVGVTASSVVTSTPSTVGTRSVTTTVAGKVDTRVSGVQAPVGPSASSAPEAKIAVQRTNSSASRRSSSVVASTIEQVPGSAGKPAKVTKPEKIDKVSKVEKPTKVTKPPKASPLFGALQGAQSVTPVRSTTPFTSTSTTPVQSTSPALPSTPVKSTTPGQPVAPAALPERSETSERISVAERIAAAERLAGADRTGPGARSLSASGGSLVTRGGAAATRGAAVAARVPLADRTPGAAHSIQSTSTEVAAPGERVALAEREGRANCVPPGEQPGSSGERDGKGRAAAAAASAAIDGLAETEAKKAAALEAAAEAIAAARARAARAREKSEEERAERSDSAEMLSAPDDDDDEDELDEGEILPRRNNGATRRNGSRNAGEESSDGHERQGQDDVVNGTTYQDEQQAEPEARMPKHFLMHEAVYDDDIDLLNILLDHYLAEQEYAAEAQEGMENNCAPQKLDSGSMGQDVFNSSNSAGGSVEKQSFDILNSASATRGGIDELDHHGNTPLLLALQLGRLECANALLEAGANVDIKSGRRYHLMDEAVLTGDRAIVRQVYMRAQKLTWLRWRARMPHLLDILESIPDFYVEMKWNFTGAFLMGPLMQAVAPSDTYKIWKRGSWLRVDSTIVGIGARFKLQRGRLSLIFMGKNSEMPGILLRVDHTKEKVYNALRRLEWQTNREVDKAVHNLMASSSKGGVDSTQFKAKKTVFRQAERSENGQPVRVALDGFKCSTYQYLGHMQMKTMRKGGNLVQFVPKHLYFNEESNKSLQAKAKEAIANDEPLPCAGSGARRGATGGMFPRPFWKSNQDVNQEKVHRQINKQVKATVWMAHDYPLKLKHIMPALEILSVRDDMAARLRSVLSLAGIPQEGFPVKVSVPLMMTVKAVVTFENFRTGPVDSANFVIPTQYKRSRRMSKELYMQGISRSTGGGEDQETGGELGGGVGGDTTGGAFDSDDEDEDDDDEEEEEEVDEDVDMVEEERRGNRDERGNISDQEMMRQRAAAGDAFEDDEEEDSDFDDDFSDDEPLSPPQPPQPPQPTGLIRRRSRSSPKSPVARGRSPFPKGSELKRGGSTAGGGANGGAPMRGRASGPVGSSGSGMAGGRGRTQESANAKGMRHHLRGRSMGASFSGRNGSGGSGQGGGSGEAGSGSGKGGGVGVSVGVGVAKGGGGGSGTGGEGLRQRSKSRGRRIVSHIKDMVGGKSKRRLVNSTSRAGSGGGPSFSDDEDDSLDEEEGVGKRGIVFRASGSIESSANAREKRRQHRRISSASATLGLMTPGVTESSPSSSSTLTRGFSNGGGSSSRENTKLRPSNSLRNLAATAATVTTKGTGVKSSGPSSILSNFSRKSSLGSSPSPAPIASAYLRAGEPPPGLGRVASGVDASPSGSPPPAPGRGSGALTGLRPVHMVAQVGRFGELSHRDLGTPSVASFRAAAAADTAGDSAPRNSE